MAARELEQEGEDEANRILSSYIGVSFSLFLALLPNNSAFLESQVKERTSRLMTAEKQLKQMKSRRKEDSKANARVVEIFASHRNAWQTEEKRLLQQIDAATEEMANLRSKIEDLQRDKWESSKKIQELEEMIGFMSMRGCEFEEEEFSECESREYYVGGADDGQNGNFGFSSEFSASASQFWAERANLWQDEQYASLESLYHMKHFVARRESPWKVDGESTGVSSKLKLLEQELLNLENIGRNDLLRVPSVMRKQAKRYLALAGKIDDLCQRMQDSDPCESTLSPEFRTQRQTEFLLEAFRLQQLASETGQKLMALQSEIWKIYYGDDMESQSKLTTRRSMDSIRNILKEIQRNLEIRLARIIGDLEGILARGGTACVRECYIPRYPFVH